MIFDKIGGLSYTYGQIGQFSQNFEKRKLTHVLIKSSAPLRFQDKLKIVVRDKKGVKMVHDYTKGSTLQAYHDYHYGANPSVKDEIFNAQVGIQAYKKPYAILAPIGHLTLGDDLQMEIEWRSDIVEGSTDPQSVEFFAYHKQDAPDHILMFDKTNDDDTTQYKVREIFALPKAETGFVNANGTYPDLRFQVETKYSHTSNSIEDYLALTGAIGNYELPFKSNFVCLGQYPQEIPLDNVRIQTTGDAACDTQLLIVKEAMISTTSDSTYKQLKEVRERVKELESKDPGEAKKRRHAGAIVKSQELDAAVNIIEAGKASDEGK